MSLVISTQEGADQVVLAAFLSVLRISNIRSCKSISAGCFYLSLPQTHKSAYQILLVAYIYHYLKHTKAHIKSCWLPFPVIISSKQRCISNLAGCLYLSLSQTHKGAYQIWLVAFICHHLKHTKAHIKFCWLPLSVTISNTQRRISNLAGCLYLSLSQTHKGAYQILLVAFISHNLKHTKAHITSCWLPVSVIISNTQKRKSNRAGCFCPLLPQIHEAADRIVLVTFRLPLCRAQEGADRIVPVPRGRPPSRSATDNPVRQVQCARRHPLHPSGKSFHCSAIAASRLPCRRPIGDCYAEETREASLGYPIYKGKDPPTTKIT